MTHRTMAFASIALVVAACTSAVAPSPSASMVPNPSVAPTTAGSTSAPSASPGPTPIPAGPDVPLAGLNDATHGWAVSGHRLLVTADGGSTWRDATPPGGFATADSDGLLGVDFVDAQHGWIAVNEAFTSTTDTSYGRVDIWRTTDAGRTWAKAQLPRARFAVFGETMPAVQLDFLDATHGFAFQSGNEAKGKNDSDLFWTADGGTTWSSDRPTGDGHQGNEGTIAFSTATDGVIVDVLHGTGIVVTHDGGRTWHDAALAIPGGASDSQPLFGNLVYLDKRSGFVVIDAHVYQTLDAGTSWTPVASVPRGVFTLAFFDANRWIGYDGTGMVSTTDGGATWVRSPAVGLPGALGQLWMADSRVGWALVWMGVCLDFKSNCSSRTGLYATADGGSSWTQLWPG